MMYIEMTFQEMKSAKAQPALPQSSKRKLGDEMQNGGSMVYCDAKVSADAVSAT